MRAYQIEKFEKTTDYMMSNEMKEYYLKEEEKLRLEEEAEELAKKK